MCRSTTRSESARHPRPAGGVRALFVGLGLLLVAGWLVAPGAVHAAPPAPSPKQRRAKPSGPPAEARELFGRGNRAFAAKDYGRALRLYRRARAVYPSYKLELNIGSTLDALGRRADAATHLERFLGAAGSSDPPRIVSGARARLRELRRTLASVRVQADDEASLRVDGKPAALAERIYLDPGSHRIEISRAAHRTYRSELQLSPGDHRQLVVQLQPLPASRPSAPETTASAAQPGRSTPASAPSAAPGPSPPRSRARDRSGPRRHKTIWGYLTLGLGLACAGSAAVLYGVGISEGARAHESYGQQASDIDQLLADRETIGAARTKLLVGHVLAGTALAALGVSLYLLLTRSETPARLSVAPSPGGGSVGLITSF